MKKIEIKSAFTLAEVLLTLIVVGVVAAMTIPSLNDYAEEQRYVAACKKAFSDISAATGVLETRYGDLQFWGWGTQATIANRYKEVMSVVDIPHTKIAGYCLGGTTGDDCGTFNTNDVYFTTGDGATWKITNKGFTAGGGAYVDVNGPNPPNVLGIDMFGFRISPNGVFAMGDTVNDKTYNWACTAYIMKRGKMPWIKDTSYANCTDKRIKDLPPEPEK